MGFVLFGISAPVFWLGLMALFIFWKKLHLTGGTGYVPITESVSGFFSHMILPWAVLALLFAATYARMTRNTLLETLGRTTSVRPVQRDSPERTVIVHHALRASLIPIVTMFEWTSRFSSVARSLRSRSSTSRGWVARHRQHAQPGPAHRGRRGHTRSGRRRDHERLRRHRVRIHRPTGAIHMRETVLEVRGLSVVFPTLDGDEAVRSLVHASSRRDVGDRRRIRFGEECFEPGPHGAAQYRARTDQRRGHLRRTRSSHAVLPKSAACEARTWR